MISMNSANQNKIGGISKKQSGLTPGTMKVLIAILAVALIASFAVKTIDNAPVTKTVTATETTGEKTDVQAEDPAQGTVTTADSKVKEYVAKAVDSEYPANKVKEGHFVSKFSTAFNYEAVIMGVFDPNKVPIKVSSERGDQVEFSKIEDGYLYFTVTASEQFPIGFMKISFREKDGSFGTDLDYKPGIEEKIKVPPKTEEIFVKISYPISR